MSLPPRSSDWDARALDNFPSLLTSPRSSIPHSPYLQAIFVAKAPWISKSQPSPVSAANRDIWTAAEREKAKKG